MSVLSPGANAALPSRDLTVMVRHGTIPGAEIDTSAFLVTANGKVRSDEDMCYYGQPSAAGGAVVHSGAAGETRFTLKLDRVPADIEKLVFASTIHENRATFSRLSEITIDAGGIAGRISCDGMSETALIVGEVYRRNDTWKVRVVGQGFAGGLAVLATHLGVDISAPAAPAPTPPRAPTPTQESNPSPVSLSKVSLTKQNSTVSLKKDDGRFGKIRVNLNWNQKSGKKGLFGLGSSAIDLDLGALIEDRAGNITAVQALGNTMGDYGQFPFTRLLGDDRTGAVQDGEWLEINGDKWSELRRLLIYAFIYEGVPNWRETDGVVRLVIPGQPEVEVRMNEFGDDRGMCAVALVENANGQVSVSREVTFHRGHSDMDDHYGWGLNWRAGRK